VLMKIAQFRYMPSTRKYSQSRNTPLC
jgi:hypothetical protein